MAIYRCEWDITHVPVDEGCSVRIHENEMVSAIHKGRIKTMHGTREQNTRTGQGRKGLGDK